MSTTDALKNRISNSFSFGGHGNLDTTMEYLLTGETPNGYMPPHVYGQAVLVRRFASTLVPKDQVVPLQNTVLNYLKGNYKKAKAQSAALPKDSRAFTQLIFQRDVKELGDVLKKSIGSIETADRLSATKSAAPTCSIHLLHGSADNVIPPHELTRLQKWATSDENNENRNVDALISTLINHVELEENTTTDKYVEYLKIIRFWSALLQNV